MEWNKLIKIKMKKVYILSAIALFAITLAGVTSAGFMKFSDKNPEKFNHMIEKKAEMFEKKQEYMTDHIERMLADEKITQEQADKKLEWMESMHEKFSSERFKGKGFHKGHKGKEPWIQK